MKHKVTSIPGDGIGPEVSRAVREIIAAAGVEIEWEDTEAKGDIHQQGAASIQAQVVESIRKNRVALKGPAGHCRRERAAKHQRGAAQGARPLRQRAPGEKSRRRPCRYQDVDMVLIRENTEDLYAGLEHTVVPGVVESLKIITERASTRIARYAFEYARKHGRKKIHAIHKANIMKLSDGLFLSSVRTVAAEYPDIEYKELIVDNACMQVVLNPAAIRHAAAHESLRRHHERSRRGTRGRPGRGAERKHREPTPQSSKRCTARRPTSRAKASPIPRRC